jgi:hypothetical protein
MIRVTQFFPSEDIPRVVTVEGSRLCASVVSWDARAVTETVQYTEVLVSLLDYVKVHPSVWSVPYKGRLVIEAV